MDRIEYGKFAGVRIGGKKKMSKDVETHLDKASWLTAQVESGGKFGTVITYDGTGVTAGIHQAIAVYPRHLDAQGPLWKLTARVLSAVPRDVEIGFREFLGNHGIMLTHHGVAISVDGDRYDGRKLRKILTGDESGVMPESGHGRDRAEMFAVKFAELFSNETSFDVQVDHGKEYFIKKAERTKLKLSEYPDIRRMTIQRATYGDENPIYGVDTAEKIGPELDLAMCVFWSNSVNAPGMALRKLCKIVKPGYTKEHIAKMLIRSLGNTTFGRWDDDIIGGRYQRTRKFAKRLWPEELFRRSGIMPKDLPG